MASQFSNTDSLTHTHTHPNHYAQLLLAIGQGSAPKHPYHPDGGGDKIVVCNRCAIRLQDVDGLTGEHLQDRVVCVPCGGLLAQREEGTHTGVELSREQQLQHGRLNVLHAILIHIEWVSQIVWDMI